jgi:predicted metal-dependent hydrolase
MISAAACHHGRMQAEPVPAPRLDPEERSAFEKGVAEFNSGYFFECHDTLEELWTGLRGPSRDFFQGLIQVSVAFYHLSNANLPGADSMLARALKRFEKYPDRYFGFDLGQHRRELRAWQERIAIGSLEELSREAPPKWRFELAS